MDIQPLQNTPLPLPQVRKQEGPGSKTSGAAPVTPRQSTGTTAHVLSAAETEFFARVFPESAGAIRAHSSATYHRTGTTSSTLPGSLVDRKG